MNRQAIIYTRFSPRPDAETSLSCEKQSERCRIYCNAVGHEVLCEFADKDISGSVLDRPGLNAAIKALQDGMVLVVDTGDRLARDMLVELTIIAQIEAKGATVEYADRSSDRTTKEGRLLRNVLAAFAQYGRETIQENTKRGLKRKREAGEWQGKPPVGYVYDKATKRLMEHTGEQLVIAVVRTMGHFSVCEIRDYINRHYDNFRGKLWSEKTIRKILKNS